MANPSTPRYQNSSLFRRGNRVDVENYSDGSKTWQSQLIQRHMQGNWTQELHHQLGFSFLVASLRYFLGKIKAFHQSFFSDTDENLIGRNEVMLVDPYFSFPVVPATTFAPF